MNIIVAVSGASGAIYARLLLDRLVECSEIGRVAVVFSSNAREIWENELAGAGLPDHPKIRRYDNGDFSAGFASGSARYDAMVIIPASMGITGRIAGGISDDLITRSADVMLKERKKLILVPRETPYSHIHLVNMDTLTLAGAVILPASPAFYSNPRNIADLCNGVVDKVLMQLGLDDGRLYRWNDDYR